MPAANCPGADHASAPGALSSTPTVMIALYGLSLVSLVFSAVASALNVTECHDHFKADEEACAQPIKDVVAITPGSFYTAKIRCYNCAYERSMFGDGELTFGDVDLVCFNTMAVC
jgi:hypothetical protein